MPSIDFPDHSDVIDGTTHVDRLYDDGGFWNAHTAYTRHVNQWMQAQGCLEESAHQLSVPQASIPVQSSSSDIETIFGTHATSLSEDDGSTPPSASFVMAQMKLGTRACFAGHADTLRTAA